MTGNVAQSGQTMQTAHKAAAEFKTGEEFEVYICIENDEYDYVGRKVLAHEVRGSRVFFRLRAEAWEGNREYDWDCPADKQLRYRFVRDQTEAEKAAAVMADLECLLRFPEGKPKFSRAEINSCLEFLRSRFG